MKIITNLIGGIAGAIALNIVHEVVKRLDHDAPRIDLVGEEAVSLAMEAAYQEPLTGDGLFTAALAGDLISNALYFSLIGNGKRTNLLVRGAGYGLGAGLGALSLTEPLGLSDAPITKTTKTQVLTVTWYVLGGLVTAFTIQALNRR